MLTHFRTRLSELAKHENSIENYAECMRALLDCFSIFTQDAFAAEMDFTFLVLPLYKGFVEIIKEIKSSIELNR